MKKTWLTLTMSMIFVLVVSVFGANFLFPMLMANTYSETTCLTDQISDDMDVYDIAKLYRDNNATFAVLVEGVYPTGDENPDAFLGSGVCIASNGYETSSLDSNIVASKGSYLVTNYHVIDPVFNSDYAYTTITVVTEDETTHDAKLLWANKNLDLAVLYCNDNFDYVEMQDRIIYPSAENAIDYEPIFTIGTPLDPENLNRLTRGDIANNNLMSGVTIIYANSPDDEIIIGLDNLYQDMIDISAGISGGNSGGGCFDENGVLIGLTTLGLSAGVTDGNQMNLIVPIYPVIEVLDKLISNKEQGTELSIITVEDLGIVGFDENEASTVSYYYEYEKAMAELEEKEYIYYYFEGEFFEDRYYADDFSFKGKGYYILRNSKGSLGGLSNGTVVKSVSINDQPAIEIENRNDFIYSLLKIDDGDEVTITYMMGMYPATKTIQF